MKHTISFDVAETLEILRTGVEQKFPELKGKKFGVEIQMTTEWRGGPMDGEEVPVVKGSIVLIEE